jgi:hypothetical protein
MTSSGRLICPGCEQLLWLRIGRKRRRHFAHRNLADCPLANQSAEVLEAKAQLYRWLEMKYPGSVHIDMTIGRPGWSELIDLVVEADSNRKFAYFVFDRQVRARENLLGYQRLSGVHAHFIHTQSTLVSHSESEITLTASQRDFIGRSDYDADKAYAGCGHLHFLDGKASIVRIYRGLRCVHRPNLYGWEALREGMLSTAKISPNTGEMVFADDVATRQEWKSRLRQAKRRETEALRSALRTGQEGFGPRPAAEVSSDAASVIHPKPTVPPLSLNSPFRCEDCGIETRDWSVATPSAGTCACKNCTRKRWSCDTNSQTMK